MSQPLPMVEPRCKYATAKCLGQDIPLVEVEKGRKVACTLYT